MIDLPVVYLLPHQVITTKAERYIPGGYIE